jgi:hypothetical protein
MRMFTSATLLFVLSGCSDMTLKGGRFDTAEATAEATAEGTLRLDIDPPDSDDGTVLLAQSHIVLPADYEGLGIELFDTRTVSGVLTAQVTRGWSLGGAPTTPEPLVADLLALAEDNRLGTVARSDADGAFTLSFPAYPFGTQLVFVPNDAAVAPLLVLDAPDIDRPRFDQEIEPGIPVYGRVNGLIDGVDTALAGVPLRISRLVNGQVISSSVFTTDATGWYVARVDQLGEYTLDVGGSAFGEDIEIAPAVSVPLLVEAPEGVEVPVSLGLVGHATADGRVVDASGERVADARVRFVSTLLDGGPGSLTLETDTNRDGRFITDLLPGIYDVEVMPRYESDAVPASPVRYKNVRVDDGVDLGELLLLPATRLAGTVLDVNERPAANVLVVATETGFAENVYSGRTGQDGTFDFPVSDVPMVVTLTPADSASGAVTRSEIEAPATVNSFQLDAGVPVSGRVTHGGAFVGTASIKVYDAGSGALLGQTFSDDDGVFALRISLPEPSRDTDTATEDDDSADTGADTADTGADTAR